MPLIEYETKKFRADTVKLVDKANEILEEYEEQGFDLTLRQLYYQFVARDIIENTQKSYKRLGSIINDARLAGLIDWESIVDRTRNLQGLQTWEDPAQIIRATVRSFRHDKWEEQEFRLECWVEKDALVNVVERACDRHQVDYFACRGYTSQSEMWRAARRLKRYRSNGQTPLVIHLGDHDPSGIDMSRDIIERLQLFAGGFEVKRIALNIDQVQQYRPPPNPAKLTDSRVSGYIDRFGVQSWELDALEPSVISDLIEDTILAHRDEDLWDEAVERENEERGKLEAIAERWDEISEDL